MKIKLKYRPLYKCNICKDKGYYLNEADSMGELNAFGSDKNQWTTCVCDVGMKIFYEIESKNACNCGGCLHNVLISRFKLRNYYKYSTELPF